VRKKRKRKKRGLGPRAVDHVRPRSTVELLDGLSTQVEVKFMLYQFPMNSLHVSKLSCEDVPIFLEEFGEREFLFGIQTIPYMRDLGGLIQG
jgi:hypothetical protein